jgi:hypothetical protein
VEAEMEVVEAVAAAAAAARGLSIHSSGLAA